MEIRDLLAQLKAKGPGSLARDSAPYLIEEGRLHHDTARVKIDVTRKVTKAELKAEDEGVVTDMTRRRVYRLAPRAGQTTGKIVVGRGNKADVKVEMSSISKVHASFEREPGGWRVRDEGSTNGTFVDGDRLPTGVPYPIRSSTVLRFSQELRLTFLEPEALEHFVVQIEAALAAGGAPDAPKADAPMTAPREALLGATALPDYLEDEDTSNPDPASPISVPVVTLPSRKAKAEEGTEPTLPEGPVHVECRPFPPVALSDGRPVSIGRVAGNDIVLPHPRVSRRHALIMRTGDRAEIIDLGSANGVFVDGKKADRKTLAVDQKVLVGPFELRLRAGAAAAPPSGGGAAASIEILGQVSLRGVLEDAPLEELLQGVEFNRKTGVVEVTGEDGTVGEISFRGGEPLAARCGDLRGEAAVKRLLRVRKGSFLVRAEDVRTRGPREVASSFTKLLLESGRERDEGTRG